MTQLVVPKKPRFGPKVASQAWWIDRIKSKEGPKYLTYWTHFTDYQIGQFKALAEYDYFALGEGIETEGAPDFGLELDYPVKLVGSLPAVDTIPPAGSHFHRFFTDTEHYNEFLQGHSVLGAEMLPITMESISKKRSREDKEESKKSPKQDKGEKDS